MSQNTANVIGTDLMAPTQYQDGQFRIWNYYQLYLGEAGEGKFVPNVGDIVEQVDGAMITRFIVMSVHPTTLISTLRQEDTSRETDPLSENDIYFGVGPGTQSDTYRVYCNKNVIPYTLTPEARCHVGGTNTVAAKIFLGANVGNNGVVISAVLNQNGETISESVPLELTSKDNVTNHSQKIVSGHHTTFDLVDGQPVTIVFYDTQGVVVSKRQCLIEISSFVRSLDASRSYVTSIALETPFMSTSSGDLIQYPMNIPLTALNLVGVVNYSDGTSRRMTVDGTRFSVLGLQGYAPTIPQQTAKIVLKYVFANNEYGIGQHIGNEQFITANYKIRASEVDGVYAVQLFAYPVWVDSVTGYQLNWFLYDLNRGIHYNVTNDVVINTNYAVFLPKGYGQKQTLSVSVNLKQVNGSYKTFYHVQVVDIQLNRRGSERPSIDHIANWQVASVSGMLPMLGNKAFATYRRVSTSDWRVKVGGGALTQSEWLAAVYDCTNPMFNPQTEIKAPTPTHFRLIAGNNSVEYPVEQWNSELALANTLTNNMTVYLEFFTRTVDNDLHTAKAGLPLYQIDDTGAFI